MRNNVKIQHYKMGRTPFRHQEGKGFPGIFFLQLLFCANVDGKIALRKKIFASSFWGICMQNFSNVLIGDKILFWKLM